ncbi:MAG: UDP-N-acetylglucosamine 1-carboxyvinyltransferase [Firmicutes bacterium]|nr:UDP-N-acetylglucosamine 1-carboxyvinyltransferase [Bacillota bacterium]
MQKKIIIEGGRRLEGSCRIKAAKNSVLPILACTVLCSGEVRLHNCPNISDIRDMLEILRSLGAKVSTHGIISGDITIDCRYVDKTAVTGDLTSAIRSSIFLLGPIVTRFGQGIVSSPGGCQIGSRPIDIHLDGLKALGVDIDDQNCLIRCSVKTGKLVGGDIRLKMPSVGATENLMMAAVLAVGRTVISNAAKEPEIVDLANFINAMGGNVQGAGTSEIVIDGVDGLVGGDFTPIPDRIVAGTYMIGCAMCGGCVRLEGANLGHLGALQTVLEKTGVGVFGDSNHIIVESNGNLISPGRIETEVYPGFATDLQAQLMAMLAVTKGESIIVENLFETRFRHAEELTKMGADIDVVNKSAIIKGVKRLVGAEVNAFDLRGGAAMVLAGLAANGTTVVSDVHYIERGYENIVGDLRGLGAEIK